MFLRSMRGKSGVSISFSPTMKNRFEFDWKMLAQDILETAKISQLSWGTFEKEKKEGVAGDISTFVGVQSLENSAFKYSSCSP